MSRKELIEDTEEVREVIAQLQAKVAAGEQDGEETAEEVIEVDTAEEVYEEDIAGDTFEEVIDETVTKGTIGDVVRENEKQRKEKKALEKEEARANRAATEKTVVRERRTAERDRRSTQRPGPSRRAETPKKAKGKKPAAKDDVIISLEGVTKSYVKGIPALNDVTLHINRGEFVFIVGDSGSGKSTLIKLLLRELKPTSGSIMVNGFQVDKLRQWKIPKLRRSMGVVFQDFRLLSDLTVYENVAFAQRIIQVPAKQMKKNVSNMLSVVGLPGKYKAKPDELSGGEMQRVALARALVNRPPILLADEPTGNLDPKNTLEIMNLLEQINKNGTTVIVVTHNDKIVNDMQKRVITIKKGVIVSDEEKGGYIDED